MSPTIEEDAKLLANADLPWDELNGKTVLVSGANGYVPAYFIHAFLKRNDIFNAGIKIIALCRDEGRAIERFGVYIGRDDFKLVIQDVCDPIVLQEDIHFFIHAASPAGVKNSNIDPVSTFTANVTGCMNMLKLSVDKNAEGFLLLSSIDVYGKISPSKRFMETDSGAIDSLNPRNVYAVAKRASENLCACYFAQYETKTVVVRPSQIIGPGIALDDGRLCADFISQIIKTGKIVLKGDGSAKRTFIYITDATTGMLTALLKGTPCEAYNIADERNESTVFDLAQLMASLSKNREISVLFDKEQKDAPEVKHAISVVTATSGKLRRLGWSPKESLSDAISRMMEFYGA